MFPTRACPNCGLIQQKDDNCDHVDCFQCKTPFNFCCSSFRSPCLAHGNHYHRPECRHFINGNLQEFVDKLEAGKEHDNFLDKCTEC